MANDVVLISGSTAIIAARLCNFVTARTFLLLTHEEFLDQKVQPVIRNMLGPWVDMFGFASRKGDPVFNQRLSEGRIASVKSRISNYANSVNFQINTAYGETRSLGDAEDNNGYFRAVEFYVYATPQPPAQKRPEDDGLSEEFGVRVLQGKSADGKGFQVDFIDFEFIDVTHRTAVTMSYKGVGGALPSIPLLPGSSVKDGPVKRFKTTARVFLTDFSGRAQIFQDPSGGAFGKFSIAGTLRLAIESEALVLKSARLKGEGITRNIVPLEGGTEFQSPGLGSASIGRLTVVGKVRRHEGPI
jgi:hypothetical protein